MDEKSTDTSKPEGTPEKTFTQAELDRVIADRLAREREKYADYDALKTRAEAADTSKPEMEKLADRVAAAEKRAEAAERTAMLADVAQAKGLTPAQVKRLSGATREELLSDADDLLSTFGAKPPADDGVSPPKEKLTSGAAPNAEPEKSAAELAEEILGY